MTTLQLVFTFFVFHASVILSYTTIYCNKTYYGYHPSASTTRYRIYIPKKYTVEIRSCGSYFRTGLTIIDSRNHYIAQCNYINTNNCLYNKCSNFTQYKDAVTLKTPNELQTNNTYYLEVSSSSSQNGNYRFEVKCYDSSTTLPTWAVILIVVGSILCCYGCCGFICFAIWRCTRSNNRYAYRRNYQPMANNTQQTTNANIVIMNNSNNNTNINPTPMQLQPTQTYQPVGQPMINNNINNNNPNYVPPNPMTMQQPMQYQPQPMQQPITGYNNNNNNNNMVINNNNNNNNVMQQQPIQQQQLEQQQPPPQYVMPAINQPVAMNEPMQTPSMVNGHNSQPSAPKLTVEGTEGNGPVTNY